jgi:hypothetical protein
MGVTERYAKALKEIVEAERAAVDSGLVGEWEAGAVGSEAYFAQRYVRVQHLVDGRKPKDYRRCEPSVPRS